MNQISRWKNAREVRRSELPEKFRGWLLDPGSLTLRMQQTCPGRFGVKVISQDRSRPANDESRLLGLRPGMHGLIRQVQLLCGMKPHIFARTVIPLSTLTGQQRQLGQLGNKPLGAFLFAAQNMRRGHTQICRVQPGEWLYEHAVAGTGAAPSEIWGRRSIFFLSNKPLLVSEIFIDPPGHCCKHWPYTP